MGVVLGHGRYVGMTMSLNFLAGLSSKCGHPVLLRMSTVVLKL